MSNYRDDVQETAVVGDSNFMRSMLRAESFARVVSAITFGVVVHTVDVAYAGDQINGQLRHNLTAQAIVSDLTPSKKITQAYTSNVLKAQDVVFGRGLYRFDMSDSCLVSEVFFVHPIFKTQDTCLVSSAIVGKKKHRSDVDQHLKAKDVVTNKLIGRIDIVDSVQVYDGQLDYLRLNIEDAAHAFDVLQGRKTSKAYTTDRIYANDKAIQVNRLDALDIAYPSDLNTHKKISKLFTIDVIQVEDSFSTLNAYRMDMSDVLRVYDSEVHRVIGFQQITDYVFADDELLNTSNQYGYAWTANTDNWGMSRYTDLMMDDLCVIDGILYGMNKEGVHLFSYQGDVVTAQVKTGELDLGAGILVHPNAVYFQYELKGPQKSLDVGMTTFQNSVAQRYVYPLQSVNKSEYVTTGRAQLGRGLRGRQFIMDIQWQGQSGRIDEINIELAGTARRI